MTPRTLVEPLRLTGIAGGLLLALAGCRGEEREPPPAAGVPSPAPRFIRAWGGLGDGDGRFFHPLAIAAAPDGAIYVADDHERVQKFDAEGRFLASWETGPVRALAVGPDGSVFVGALPLRRYSPDGDHLETFEMSPDNLGLAVSAAGEISLFGWPGIPGVKAAPAVSLWRLSATGDELDRWQVPAGSLAAAPDGALYGLHGDRLRRWEAGEAAAEWTLSGAIAQEGIAIGGDGSVYVTCRGEGQGFVCKYSPAGELILAWSALDEAHEPLRMPMGIAVAADGSILVTDWLRNYVAQFNPG